MSKKTIPINLKLGNMPAAPLQAVNQALTLREKGKLLRRMNDESDRPAALKEDRDAQLVAVIDEMAQIAIDKTSEDLRAKLPHKYACKEGRENGAGCETFVRSSDDKYLCEVCNFRKNVPIRDTPLY